MKHRELHSIIKVMQWGFKLDVMGPVLFIYLFEHACCYFSFSYNLKSRIPWQTSPSW